MSWSSRKQFKYIFLVLIFIGIIIFLFLIPVIFKQPTCSDGKQNGTEEGIDCGGSCSLLCQSDILEPVVKWSRAFHVVDNTYNLVAFVENRNKESGVKVATYEFRVYDKNNTLLGRREGTTFIPPNQEFAVFESRFDSGENEVKSVSFEFLPTLTWVKKTTVIQTLPITVKNIVMDNNEDTPTLSATINNNSIYDLPEFDVIAVLYDAEGNAINASKTHKSKLLSDNNLPVVFTWPETLSTIPAKQDIMILVNPFLISF
jgi:hypothetical protein